MSASPLALSVLPAASKADDPRAKAVKTAVEPRAASAVPRALPPSDSAPAALDAPVNLDAFFDGSLPTSREILSRAASRNVPDSALALALSASRSPADAAARLSALGVLGSKESAFSEGESEDVFRILLTRLWNKTFAAVPAPFPVDSSFGVPALKVTAGAATYYVHGVAHGELGAPRRGAVRSTVRRIAAAGHALYSEQNLPAHYGYKYGFETLDQSGVPLPAIVPAAPGFTRSSLRWKRAIDLAVAPGAFLAGVAWTFLSPSSWLAWIFLIGAGALSWLVLTGGLPFRRWKVRRLAARFRASWEDGADQFADEARHAFVSKPDLKVLRALELPQPLGSDPSDKSSVRSRSIADAASAHAAATGAAAVHLVVGHQHVHETAWRLAHGPATTRLGPIDS